MGGSKIKKSSIDEFIGLIESKKSIVISGHRETDADSLFSTLFFSKLVKNINPKAENYPIIDNLEDLTWDTSEFVKKYSLETEHIKSVEFKTKPDLFILVDTQIGTNYELIPKGMNLDQIDVACWDHHYLKKGFKYKSDFRDDSVNSTASMILNYFLKEENIKHLDFLKGSSGLCTIGYQALIIDTGLKEEILVESDKKAHDFFQNNSADLIFIHNLDQRKISEATASILAKAYEDGRRKNIGNIVTFCYTSKINDGQSGELATVANDILRIETSLNSSIAAGIVEETEDEENMLKISARVSNPDRNLNAQKIAKIYGGGGDRYKGGAQINLKLFKHSVASPEFEELISDEIEYRLLGSKLNEAKSKQTKKTLEKPVSLKDILKSGENEGDVMSLMNNATENYALRANEKYITLFANGNPNNNPVKKLGEDDISPFIEVEDFYLNKAEKYQTFKSCKSSVIYGLINDEVKPYVLCLVSVKKNGNGLNSEEIAKEIFKCTTPEILTMEEDDLQRTIARVELSFLEYTSQHEKLNKVVYSEMEERLRIVLGDKKE